MDTTDSSVSMRVYTTRSGPATLGIRYANGSRDANNNAVPATDRVTVNGHPAGTLTLTNTAWGNWTMAAYRVPLHNGFNTVTLTKDTYYAEIDAIDLYRGRVAPTPVEPAIDPTAPRCEAEDGVVTHARVLSDPGASNGAKVGGLDFPDSSVTLTVQAPRSGVATLGIRFANGSLDRSGYPVESTETVTVNGHDAGIVQFRNTTWGNWSTHAYQVRLKKGSNTVTLTHDTFYAEIDAADADF